VAGTGQFKPRRSASIIRGDLSFGKRLMTDDGIAERVWQVIALIPPGRVTTYGRVAVLAGIPGGARRVGRVLSQLPRGTRLPWHRVVNASGGISLPPGSTGHRRQRSLLRSEGIEFGRTGRIALSRFGWQP
jgi:methylated-DNA-protein-cysteine methyltransferase-like protein